MPNQFPEWTKQELNVLSFYPTHGVQYVMNLIPKRSKKSIQKKAIRMGHIRSVAAGNKMRARQFTPSITPEFAWLTAMYQGDGWITNKKAIIGLTSVDRELVEYYRYCLSLAYDDPSILDVEIKEVSPEEANRYNKNFELKFCHLSQKSQELQLKGLT